MRWPWMSKRKHDHILRLATEEMMRRDEKSLKMWLAMKKMRDEAEQSLKALEAMAGASQD